MLHAPQLRPPGIIMVDDERKDSTPTSSVARQSHASGGGFTHGSVSDAPAASASGSGENLRKQLGGWRTALVKQSPAPPAASAQAKSPSAAAASGARARRSSTPTTRVSGPAAQAKAGQAKAARPSSAARGPGAPGARRALNATQPSKAGGSLGPSGGTTGSAAGLQSPKSPGKPTPFCLFCGSVSHVVAVEVANLAGHRTVLCPWLEGPHTDASVALTDVTDDGGNPLPPRWADWVRENLSIGVGRDVVLAILAENKYRPRAAIALYGPQSDMKQRAVVHGAAKVM